MQFRCTMTISRQFERDNFNDQNYSVQSLVSENTEDEISSSESDEDEIQSELSPTQKRLPEIGMEFSSEETAYKFYKKYAEEVGFSVRKGKVQRLVNRSIRKRNFLCSREGFKVRKMSSTKTAKYKRKETRTGCSAGIQFTVENGKWVISNYILEHNHELVTPWERHVSLKTIEDDVRKGIKEDQTAKCVKLQQVNPTTENCVPHKIVMEGVQSLMDYFTNLQVQDPSFFYSIQVDAENKVTNFFWRDFRSRMDYDHFGDVLVLDTTFRSHNMIYAAFWGINHHQKCVLFGCAFLFDETLNSFVWLLKTFMIAMGNRQPITLFTDECQTVASAIELVIPKTQHRLGVSYVYKNAKQHLWTFFEQPGFESLFSKCMFECQSEQEFELQWNSLLEQYNLRESPWLKVLHISREKWCHLFGKKIFSAGIESMLNSTNVYAFFRDLTSDITSLPCFFLQYIKEVEQRRLEEVLHDDLTESMRSRKGMEKHAEDIYTLAIFKKFQDELLDSLSLAIEKLPSSGSISEFKLTEEGHKEEVVTFDCSGLAVTCSCGKFESTGILCGHSIKVLNANNIFQIPSQYILKRWRKSAKEEVMGDDQLENDCMGDNSQRQLRLFSKKLLNKAFNVITKSVAIEETRKIVEGYLDMASQKAEDILKAHGKEQTNLASDTHVIKLFVSYFD
ncbi:hypothetical protein UlMin_020464 [Ulmus minor]